MCCDTLATQAVAWRLSMSAVSQHLPPLSLPFKNTAIIIGRNKLTYVKWFYTKAEDICDNSIDHGGLRWTDEHIKLVDWESLDATLKGKPDMFCIWLAKQCIRVNAMRRNMARIKVTEDAVCPHCKLVWERSDHLNPCNNVG